MEEKSLIILQRLEGNEPTHLSGMQTWIAPYTHIGVICWWFVFCATVGVVIFVAIRRIQRGE